MIFNFTTFIKKENRFMITLPSDLCKKNTIMLKDILLVQIEKFQFPAFVVGDKLSKRITLPLKILNQLENGNQRVIIETLPERKSFVKIEENTLDLFYALPERPKHFDWPLLVAKKDKKIIVWSPKAYQVVIPRHLMLDEEFFEIYGLIQGEGYKKSPVGGTRFEFVNEEGEIINKILTFFKNRFEIPTNHWSAYINYVVGSHTIKKSKEELINYWSNSTNIPIINFKRVNYLRGKGINSAPFGVLHIFIPSCVLGEISLAVLEIAEKLASNNKRFAIPFLRGLMAADGSATLIQYKHYKTLRIVELALENNHEYNIYNKIICKIGLNAKDYSLSSRKLCLSGWEDFIKLADITIFKLHTKKKNLFETGFKNHMQTRMFKKYLVPLNKKNMTIKELKTRLNLKSKGSIHQTMRLNMKKGFIFIKKGKENRYYLTKKGKSILKILERY
jgi:hypothetical protein